VFDPLVVANAGWGTPEEIASGGYIVLVVVTSGSGHDLWLLKNKRDAERLRQQIMQEDNDIIAVVIAALHAGVLD
jgi:hypothetical protein